MKKSYLLLSVLLCLALFLSACNAEISDTSTQETNKTETLSILPPPEPDNGPFGIDSNINMSTIDDFLNRPDVAYIDVRMLYDPANYEAIGGISRLTQTLPGYRVTPFPFIANLGTLPVEGRYEGDTLFTIVWGENRGEVVEITPNYVESEMILSELFPKDKIIFLMCGGAGYSSLARGLLLSQGWDPSKVYHTGGNWHYTGSKGLDMQFGDGDGIATWRVNYAHIDFSRLNRIAP